MRGLWGGTVAVLVLAQAASAQGAATTLTIEGTSLMTLGTDQTVDRFAVSGGWFVTPNVLLKAEYVTQSYDNFPTSHILNGGKFDGLVLQGVVGF